MAPFIVKADQFGESLGLTRSQRKRFRQIIRDEGLFEGRPDPSRTPYELGPVEQAAILANPAISRYLSGRG
jgi:hypothetical protein